MPVLECKVSTVNESSVGPMAGMGNPTSEPVLPELRGVARPDLERRLAAIYRRILARADARAKSDGVDGAGSPEET